MIITHMTENGMKTADNNIACSCMRVCNANASSVTAGLV